MEWVKAAWWPRLAPYLPATPLVQIRGKISALCAILGIKPLPDLQIDGGKLDTSICQVQICQV